MIRLLFLFLLFITAQTTGAQLLIRNVTVVDTENKKLLRAQNVVVVDGRIAALGNQVRYKLPPGTPVIDGTGKFLMPGLVDAHVHFFQSGGVYARPDAVDLRKYQPYNREIEWVHRNMEAFLRRYTSAGITTVIDVGSTLNFLKQRDTFRNKPYAPAVYMTGPLLTTWEPPIYKGLGGDAPFFEMTTPEQARQYVQQELPYKPDFIKIWYIVRGPNYDSSARASLPLVQAVIDEAKKAGLRVAVHATQQIAARLAVEAGAHFLVHNVEDRVVDVDFMQLLKEKGVVLNPTLVVGHNYGRTFTGNYPITAEDWHHAHPTPLGSVIDFTHLPDTAITARYQRLAPQVLARSKRNDSLLAVNVKKMLDAGVTIATGTDAGNVGTQHASSYYDELRAMQAAGFTTWQLLQSSTINGAKALGKEGEFGSIQKGKVADMVLLSADPTQSLDNWKKIDLVINKGVALKPDSLLVSTPEMLAQQQLNAYNAHNLEAFLEPYAEDVEIYTFPNELRYKGKEQMRKAYEFVEKTPELYCRLLNRIVQGNTVIDHEEVYGKDGQVVYAVAVYKVYNGKIRQVYFIR
ncbi:MAG TPA: amidohydrolase family protein [Chitinophagaceae bacterium]